MRSERIDQQHPEVCICLDLALRNAKCAGESPGQPSWHGATTTIIDSSYVDILEYVKTDHDGDIGRYKRSLQHQTTSFYTQFLSRSLHTRTKKCRTVVYHRQICLFYDGDSIYQFTYSCT